MSFFSITSYHLQVEISVSRLRIGTGKSKWEKDNEQLVTFFYPKRNGKRCRSRYYLFFFILVFASFALFNFHFQLIKLSKRQTWCNWIVALYCSRHRKLIYEKRLNVERVEWNVLQIEPWKQIEMDKKNPILCLLHFSRHSFMKKSCDEFLCWRFFVEILATNDAIIITHIL